VSQWPLPADYERWLLQRRPRPLRLVYVASHGARALIETEPARLDYRKGMDYLHVGCGTAR
jgi:hypothetical protein